MKKSTLIPFVLLTVRILFFSSLVFPQTTGCLTYSGTKDGCVPWSVTFQNCSDPTGLDNFVMDYADGSTETRSASDTNQTYTHTYLKVNNYKPIIHGYSGANELLFAGLPVSIYGRDDPSIAKQYDIICKGVATFTDNSTKHGDPNGSRTVTWDFGDGGTATGDVGQHSYPMVIDFIYTINMNVSNNCGDSSTQTTIHVIPMNPIIQLSQALLCKGGDIKFSNSDDNPAYNYSYTWDFGDGTATSILSSPVHQFSTAGNFKTMVTVINPINPAQCTEDTSLNITVLDAPVTAFALNYAPACDSVNVSFINNTTGAVVSYHWDFGNGDSLDIATNTTQNSKYNPAGFYYISLTAKSLNNCAITRTDTLIVPSTPRVWFTFKNICEGQTGQFLDSTTVLVGTESSWQWHFGDNTTSISQSPFKSYNVNGNIKVTLIVTAGICSDSASRFIRIDPLPKASITPVNVSNCSPLNVNFTNSTTGIISKWTWDFGDGIVDSVKSPLHTYTNYGSRDTTYNASMIASTAFGCIDTANSTITVYYSPKAFFTSDAGEMPTCGPLNIKFSSQSLGASSIKWDFGDSTLAVGDTVSHAFVNTNPYFKHFRVKEIAFTSNGCSDTSATQYVTLYPRPLTNFTADTLNPCQPMSFIFTAQREKSAIYFWDFGDGTKDSTQANIVTHIFPVVQNTARSFNVKLKSSTEFNCTDSTVMIITIKPGPFPKVDFSLDTSSGCPPLTKKITDLSTCLDPSSYIWDFGDGTQGTGQSVEHTFYNQGPDTIKLTAMDYNSRTFAKDTIINIYTVPIASFTYYPKNPGIPDDSVHFQPAYPDSIINGQTYLWHFGDGDSSSLKKVSHMYRDTGSFYPSLTVTSDKGCTNTFAPDDFIDVGAGGTLDAPNAFIPDNSGPGGGATGPDDISNLVFAPVSKGVIDYHLEIYDRWGEKIFSSDTKEIGWDGYYMSRLCKQDVYVWKVTGKYVNGRKFTKVGSVTLFHK